MILFLLAYLGGAFTILSPCILPVLPFVFARSDQPFVKSGLPLLLGMAVTFAGVASLAAVGGGWVVQANGAGRIVAMVVLLFFGLLLLFPALADRATRPLVALGSRLTERASGAGPEGGKSNPFWTSLLLGVATGLLWAPCAGPILGLVLTGAALQGANVQTSLLLLAYAAGAATSLALALLIGGSVFKAMKRSLGAGEWIRRGLGAAVLCGVVAIAFGLDTGFLTRVSLASTASVEQSLVDKVPMNEASDAAPSSVVMKPDSNVMMSGSDAMKGGAMMSGSDAMKGAPAMMNGSDAMKGAPAMMNGSDAMKGGPSMAMMMKAKPAVAAADALPVEGQAPSLSGAVEWLNSPPLTNEALRGKVVLVDFWTYSCINCLRAIPYVRAWADKYKDQGLVVIGVHAPEFAFEKNIDNVRQAIKDLKIDYPVAIDNDYAIWRAFNNSYWPAHYFIDAQGRIRHHHFGEGEYDQSEKIIQQLLAEAGKSDVAQDIVKVNAQGAEAAADMDHVMSPETYVGYARAENFASPGGVVNDKPQVYAIAPQLALNQWALAGDWTIGGERAVSNEANAHIAYRFHARDLHLVLGPSADGKPVRFRVTIDGKAPGADHGADVDEQGNGTVSEQRLYQLVRQSRPDADRQFEIEFLDPGAQAFAFTFG
jgi:cytochrome c biogenesis protein CcdA/thiol-disulfide isomerase/thioredoxin